MSRSPRIGKGTVLFAMTVAVMFIAGGAFFYKMTEFVVTMARGDIEGFGAVAVATYLIGMMPLMLLTLWAVLTGRFRDIERPKLRLFELDAEIEAGGELGRDRVAPETGGERGRAGAEGVVHGA